MTGDDGIPAVLAAGLEPAAASALASTAVRLVAAADGDRALEALRAGGLALAVVEHGLPGRAAVEVLETARREGRAVPVLYLLPRGAETGLSRERLGALGIERLLFHPVDPAALAAEAASVLGLPAPPSPSATAVREAVGAVWSRFRHAVLARVTALEEAAVALLQGRLDAPARREAEREAHKLAGSVGTFGFAEGSRIARELEHLLEGTAPLGPADALRLSDGAVALRAVLERAPAGTPAAPAVIGDARPGLLVVDDDGELAERLVMEASARGFRVRAVPDPAAARAAVGAERPAAVVLETAVDGAADGEGIRFLAQMTALEPPVPVVVLTRRQAFSDRVEAARHGASAFLPKPTPPARAIDAVEEVLDRRDEGRTTVLVVDDDAGALEAVRALLEPTGVTVRTLDDPLRFWESLESAEPDVVVLDVDMPHLSGVELCRVVRNDPRWNALPVLFLSARTDPDSIQALFAAGADDYVAKPFAGPELVTRIANRVERVQLHRRLAETDALTQVANRRKSEEAMERFLALAQRQGAPLSLAVLDLDHFKSVNDRAGHATGDEVLRRVGQLLSRAFRAEDVVARWGGEEFVVSMYGSEKDDGVRRVEAVLDALRAEEFSGPEPFSVTFSAGVAQYPLDGGDLATLYRSADAALYLAKEHGRARVLPAGWKPGAPSDGADHVDVLVVEDDEALARLLLHALETRGYRTRWIADGRAAADALLGPRPALRARVVLLDVDLPVLDGLGLLRALAAARVLDRTRVVMLTVRAVEQEVVQALELGAFDHVAKPFSVPVLLQRVRRALRP